MKAQIDALRERHLQNPRPKVWTVAGCCDGRPHCWWVDSAPPRHFIRDIWRPTVSHHGSLESALAALR